MLMLAFAVQTFNKAFIVFDYYTNTAAYAQNCENKAKPKMACHGKCQMMKKLKEEEKKEQDNPERKAEYKSEVVLSSRSFFPALNHYTILVDINFPVFFCKKESKMSRSVFHPPSIV